VAGNPDSFLRVGRADLELPDEVDPYSDAVYARGRDNLDALVERGALAREPEPMVGVYRQRMGDHVQTGIVALSAVEEYDRGVIKKHEYTRPAKEADRVRVIEIHDSQSGPVFVAYRGTPATAAWLETVTAAAPEVSFTAPDGVEHSVWPITDPSRVAEIVAAFEAIPATYIADGHHRSAAASRVHAKRGSEASAGFLTVLFAADELKILPYNRVVRDLNGREAAAFLAELSDAYDVGSIDRSDGSPPAGGFDLYLSGRWHRAAPRDGRVPADPVGKLAVSVLEQNVLKPILGIHDQRTDERIDFVGGIRGIAALEERVDSGEWAVAFAMYPTTVDELLDVADADQVMPPKSTWFEPKLRDGLFVHVLD